MAKRKPKIEVADLICEFFEVAVHNILYVRKLYPETIFKTKRKYGVVVYQSEHPLVNEYITSSLKAIQFHARKSKLRQIFLCIISSDKVIERFVFDIVKLVNNIDNDPFLVNLESCLRDFCVKLHTSHTYMDDLPGDAHFAIQLHTTEYSVTEFNQIPNHEDFPWIEVKTEDISIRSPDVVPLHTVEVDYLTMQMYIEKECPD